MYTKSQKAQLTKDIKRMQEYANDINDQIANQHPQPNGSIFLHGDIIAWKTEGGRIYKTQIARKAERELSQMKIERMRMDGFNN